jgi:hypothetical protein
LATIPLQGVCAVATFSGNRCAELTYPEGATSAGSWKRGGAVIISGGGGLVHMAVNGSGWGLLGFANAAATGTQSTDCPVMLANTDTIFEGNVGESNTSANAVTAAGILGMTYGLTSLSGRTYVDLYKTDVNSRVFVHKLSPKDALGDLYGRVLFTVLPQFCQQYRCQSGYEQAVAF